MATPYEGRNIANQWKVAVLERILLVSVWRKKRHRLGPGAVLGRVPFYAAHMRFTRGEAQWGVSPRGEVTHGLDCSGGIGSLLNAPHCAFTKLATDTKQNTTAELSHVFSTGKEVRRQGNYHGLGRDGDKICSKRKL